MKKLLILIVPLIFICCANENSDIKGDKIDQKEIVDIIDKYISKTKDDPEFSNCNFIEFKILLHRDSCHEEEIYFDVYIDYIPINEIGKLYDNTYSVCEKIQGKRILALLYNKSELIRNNKIVVDNLIKSEYPDYKKTNNNKKYSNIKTHVCRLNIDWKIVKWFIN